MPPRRARAEFEIRMNRLFGSQRTSDANSPIGSGIPIGSATHWQSRDRDRRQPRHRPRDRRDARRGRHAPGRGGALARSARELAASLETRRCVPGGRSARARTAPAAVVAATVAQFGRLDLLVNNAGATKRGDFLDAVGTPTGPTASALKFFGAMRGCRAAWPHLQRLAAPSSTSSASAVEPARRSSPLAARSTRRCST